MTLFLQAVVVVGPLVVALVLRWRRRRQREVWQEMRDEYERAQREDRRL